jgi:hypothetical protein
MLTVGFEFQGLELEDTGAVIDTGSPPSTVCRTGTVIRRAGALGPGVDVDGLDIDISEYDSLTLLMYILGPEARRIIAPFKRPGVLSS